MSVDAAFFAVEEAETAVCWLVLLHLLVDEHGLHFGRAANLGRTFSPFLDCQPEHQVDFPAYLAFLSLRLLSILVFLEPGFDLGRVRLFMFFVAISCEGDGVLQKGVGPFCFAETGSGESLANGFNPFAWVWLFFVGCRVFVRGLEHAGLLNILARHKAFYI
jgi:hypothetical protein